MWTMRLGSALFLLLLMVTGTASAQKSMPKGMSREPDVLVVVNSMSDGGFDQVSFTFPRKVNHAVAKDYLSKLIKETHWESRDVQITDEGETISGRNEPMTSVAFATRFGVLRSEHNLLVGPIIKAFRDKTHLLIYYVVAPPFEYRGLTGTFEDPNVRINSVQQGTTYIFDVTVKKHGLSAVKLPPTRPAATATAPATGSAPAKPRPGRSPMSIVLVFLAAIVAAVVGYVLAGKYISSGARR